MIIINWTSADRNTDNPDTALHTNPSGCSWPNLKTLSIHVFGLAPCTPVPGSLSPQPYSHYDRSHRPSETPQLPRRNALLTYRTISSFFHCSPSTSNILQSLSSIYPSPCAASLLMPYINIMLLFIGLFSLIELSSIKVHIAQIQ